MSKTPFNKRNQSTGESKASSLKEPWSILNQVYFVVLTFLDFSVSIQEAIAQAMVFKSDKKL